jgi:hypothetical protein
MPKQHTPGPWRVEADAENADKHPFHRYRYVTSDTPNGKTTICVMMDCHRMAQDAGLIAMAPMIPDLLEALDDTLSRFHVETQADQVRYKQVLTLLQESQWLLARVDGA